MRNGIKRLLFTFIAQFGNGAKVYQRFGDNLDNILKELTEKLVS